MHELSSLLTKILSKSVLGCKVGNSPFIVVAADLAQHRASGHVGRELNLDHTAVE